MPVSVRAVLDWADRLATRLSPYLLAVVGGTAVYYIAFSYGVCVVLVVVGREETIKIMGNIFGNPAFVIVGIPLIPLALIALESADLAGRGLLLWREKVSPALDRLPVLGSLIKWMWPTPNRKPLPSSQDGLGGNVDFLARSISAGLLLPFAAYVVGKTCLRPIKSNARKVILGGVLFYSFKTMLKMYLMQQEFRRQGNRRVLNYDHSFTSASSPPPVL